MTSHLTEIPPHTPDKELELRDPRFRHDLLLSPEVRAAMLADLFPLLVVDRDQNAERGLGNKTAEKYKAALSAIVANLICQSGPAGRLWVRYGRSKADYAPSQYRTGEFAIKVFLTCMNVLLGAGLIEQELGVRDEWGGKGKQTRFRARPELLKKIASWDGFNNAVMPALDGPFGVILRDKDKKQIEYDPDAEPAHSLLADVRQINAHMIGANVTLEADALADIYDPWVVSQPTSRTCRRIFNNSDWNQNGRFYGPWWINMKSSHRHAIRIDGEETAGLDFSAFSARAIYHRLGLVCPEDPYFPTAAAEKCRALGLNSDDIRKGFKTLLVILINDIKQTHPKYYSRHCGLTPHFKMAEASDMLIDHNRPISENFGKGQGLRIMALESQIAAGVMKDGIDAGSTVLSIHDGFIVKKTEIEWLRKRMRHHYESVIGHNPVISIM